MVKVTVQDIAKACDKLSSDEDKLKALLRYWFSFEENILVFSKFCFPEYCLGNSPSHHNDFIDFLLDEDDGSIASPRGSAKSTVTGLFFISWCLVYNKEKYIVYVSQNHAKTVQFVEPIATEFKLNNRLRWLYGDLTPKKNKDESGRDREDCVDINGCRVEAVSFEKNLRGFKYGNMRPTLIICDDIEEDSRVINPILRQKDSDKLNKVIIPSLDINGRLKMIGTILHLDSLLMKKIRLYKGKIFKIEYEDGRLLWGERFTKEKLNKIKASIGSVAYQQEYLNNPVDNSTSVIKSEWVRGCYDYNYNYSYDDMDELYLGVDFAFSDRVSADNSAFVDIGIKGNKKYLLNIILKKGQSLPKQMTFIESLYSAHNYDIIALEENSIKSISADMTDFKLPIKMFWTGSRDDSEVNKIKKTNKAKTYSKVNAINRLSVEFENKMWVIPYKTEKQQQIADSFTSEATSWALEDGKLVELGEHPDSPIGVIMVNEALRIPKQKMGVVSLSL